MDLGGIMFWSIDNDDFRGSCHDKPYPLIEAGKEALLGYVTYLNIIVLISYKQLGKLYNVHIIKKIIFLIYHRDSKVESSQGKESKIQSKSRAKPRPAVKSTTAAQEKSVASTTTPEPPTTPDTGTG